MYKLTVKIYDTMIVTIDSPPLPWYFVGIIIKIIYLFTYKLEKVFIKLATLTVYWLNKIYNKKTSTKNDSGSKFGKVKYREITCSGI